ncbi:hypothetical protein [Sinorhizobium medicae]|uniref:hypothetical protein n=1 Tax=Sinorhizobium medicae TaxID=110321 RepID=UPI000C7C0CB7|nr:hypothetical protein [Sinorhizobium medicae]PLU26168.1 hypothetical protein BMJ28_32880 [Sinorhizobium medicae]WQO62520.1 hypothetical protein U8C35_33990 [Sinorhizobium medicae]WQO89007.1 hypothetical protein U8C37_31355 [Sinorhizobium medicae]
MFDRLARVVAKHTAKPVEQTGARFRQPEGPGIFPLGSAAIVSAVPSGTAFANRRCPDENLLRQNVSI